ncbi:hypothetical protein U1Q18_022602 [Sarracenia purpurea var. burkii]
MRSKSTNLIFEPELRNTDPNRRLHLRREGQDPNRRTRTSKHKSKSSPSSSPSSSNISHTRRRLLLSSLACLRRPRSRSDRGRRGGADGTGVDRGGGGGGGEAEALLCEEEEEEEE